MRKTDGESLTAKEGCEEENTRAGQSGATPELSADAPRQSEDAARSGEMPERSGDTAERSADAPGRARGAGCGSAVLAERMLRYFSCPPDPRKQAPPSFVGFALSQDMTVTELEALCRKNRRLGEAYGECRQRVMQWLIDGALQKYYDSSLVKLLLTSCYGVGEEKAEAVDRTFRIEVV